MLLRVLVQIPCVCIPYQCPHRCLFLRRISKIQVYAPDALSICVLLSSSMFFSISIDIQAEVDCINATYQTRGALNSDTVHNVDNVEGQNLLLSRCARLMPKDSADLCLLLISSKIIFSKQPIHAAMRMDFKDLCSVLMTSSLESFDLQMRAAQDNRSE